jgi:3-deoxy-D-manno-octulosonate 8-phosphate phosphatase (KDO 8-P phosphatase)
MPKKSKLAKTSLAKIKPLKALLLDCDGILTDAKVWYGGDGAWRRSYSIRDGFGLKKLIDAGFTVGIITSSATEDIRERVKSLKIQHFYEGRFDKVNAYNDFKKKTGFKDAEVAYMGDDDPDVPLLEIVGFAATVADAMPSAIKAVDYVTQHKGGDGGVREVCELIIENSKWYRSLLNAKV